MVIGMPKHQCQTLDATNGNPCFAFRQRKSVCRLLLKLVRVSIHVLSAFLYHSRYSYGVGYWEHLKDSSTMVCISTIKKYLVSAWHWCMSFKREGGRISMCIHALTLLCKCMIMNVCPVSDNSACFPLPCGKSKGKREVGIAEIRHIHSCFCMTGKGVCLSMSIS